jgi:chemotaxis protein CheX
MRTVMTQPSHTSVRMEPGWKTILECAAREVFEMMAGLELASDPGLSSEQQGSETAMVGLAGALCGMVTVRCSRKVSGRIAACMLGGEEPSNSTTARDALGELCNMIAGNFKGKISQLADQCMLSVPTVISGEDYSMSPMSPSKGLTCALGFEDERIWVSLVIQS